VRREWDRRRDQLLADANPATLARNVPEFRALRDRQLKLEQFFTALAAHLAGAGAFPAFEPRGIASDLAPALVAWATARREQAIENWLGSIAWSGVLPALAADAFIAGDTTRRAREALEADWREALALGTDFSAIAERLVAGDSIEGAETTFEKWSQRPLLRELASAGPFRALLDAGATLAAIKTEQRREELVAKAAAPSFGIALAAWRRLGELPTWPAPAELDTELRVTRAIVERAGSAIRDAARRSAFLNEAAREQARRWRVALRSTKDDAALAQILGRRGDFGVKDSELAPDERFNVELLQLKQVDWRALPDAQIVARRDEAVSRLRAPFTAQIMPPTLAPWFKALLDLVLTDAQGGQSDIRKLGPGTVGWEGELSADGRTVTFKKKFGAAEQRLAFTLIEGEKSVPFFLGTSEVSTGLFLDLLGEAAVKTKLQRWLTDVAGSPDDDPRNGPQLWKLDRRRGAVLNNRWTGNPLPTWPKEFYPAGIPDAAQPPRTAPLQYIPPQAAQYLAQDVLGARLPTPDEWRALVEAGLPAKLADPKGPNLRDALWQKERDYLAAANVADQPIDAEIFWPAGAGTLKRGRQAQAVAPERDDGALWFLPAAGDDTERVRHLYGNVAEYLFDENAGKFYVAGGSALSPPEVDPATPYPVDLRLAASGFSDVGLRLAFSAPGGVAGRSRLQIYLRNQPLLRAP
jgi:hypothetical protein